MSENTSVMRLGHTKKNRGIFKALMIGFFSAAAFALGALLLFAGILFRSEDPGKFLFPISMGALFLTAFLFGFISAKSYGGQGALLGVLSGGTLFLLLFFVALLCGLFQEKAFITCALYVSVALVSVLGGMLGGKKRTARRKLSFR